MELGSMFSRKKLQAFATHPLAIFILGGVAFIESFFFPLPADILFIPMILAQKQRTRYITTVAIVGSCLGSIFGYGLGYYGYEEIVRPLAHFMGISNALESMRLKLQSDITLLWTLLMTSGLFHIPPIKVVTVGSGMAHVPFDIFVVSTFISRLVRFVLLAELLKRLTPQHMTLLKHHKGKITLCLTLIVAGIIAWKVFYSN
jgi:membrane protein YqaA with SNARE-associated domain